MALRPGTMHYSMCWPHLLLLRERRTLPIHVCPLPPLWATNGKETPGGQRHRSDQSGTTNIHACGAGGAVYWHASTDRCRQERHVGNEGEEMVFAHQLVIALEGVALEEERECGLRTQSGARVPNA